LNQKNKFPDLAGYTPLKYVVSGKQLIASEPEIGKFQKWVEMKVNYPTDKENTPEDFSDNFRNIKNFQITKLKAFRISSVYSMH
jgi:hypothetical protein